MFFSQSWQVQNVHWYSFRDIILATKGGKEAERDHSCLLPNSNLQRLRSENATAWPAWLCLLWPYGGGYNDDGGMQSTHTERFHCRHACWFMGIDSEFIHFIHVHEYSWYLMLCPWSVGMAANALCPWDPQQFGFVFHSVSSIPVPVRCKLRCPGAVSCWGFSTHWSFPLVFVPTQNGLELQGVFSSLTIPFTLHDFNIFQHSTNMDWVEHSYKQLLLFIIEVYAKLVTFAVSTT